MNGYGLVADNGSRIVQEIGAINIEGNVMPMSWFDHVRFENGKPHTNAIVILSDIVYWYRPVEVRDEKTSRPMEWRKKFKGEYLQRTCGDIAERFGFSSKQVRDALACLERHGLIRLHIVKSLVTDDGKVLGNVPYIELIPERLKEITLYPYKSKGIHLEVRGSIPTSQTYTEITTETTTKKKTTRGGNGTATEGFSDIQQPPLLEPEVVVVETHISPPAAPKPTPAPRPRDLMYDAIEETWGTYAGGRIGKLKRQLLGNIPKSERGHEANFETPATPDEVRGFGAWWKRTYPKLPLPMDAVKVQDHFYKFRATAVMPVVAEAGMVERNGHWLRKW